MYRSVIPSTRIFLYQNNFWTQTTYLISSKNRQISSSLAVLKQNHQISNDDLRDIPLYNETERIQKLSMGRFSEYLKQQLICPSSRAMEICISYPEFKDRSMLDVKKNVDLLTLKGVTHTTILDNPWMLTLNHEHLTKSLQVLEEMKPENINDFAPLAVVPPESLIEIKKLMDEDKSPCRHRIYYLSKLLDTKPHKVSKYASNRLYLLQMPFKDLDTRLKALLKNMPSKVVVKSLSLMKNPTTKIESRIAQALDAHLSLKPSWLMKSKKDFLALIEEFNKQNEVLGGRSLKQYFADRLKLDIQTIEIMLEYNTRIKNCNVISIKEKLDYLLNEAGVSAIEIVRNSQILIRPLQEMKDRFQELQSYGIQSDVILRPALFNSKDYNNFVIKLKSQQEEKAVNKI